MFSDNPGDKKMRRIIAGAAVAGAAVVGANRLSNPTPPTAPVPVANRAPSELALAIGAHKARMEAEMTGLNTEQIDQYLVNETSKAASMRARGILDGESPDLYYDFLPLSAAIADVLERQERDVRDSVASKLRLRRKLFEGNPTNLHAYQEKLLEIFSASYENPVQAVAAIERHRQSNPEFMEVIHNELLGAYITMCEKMAQDKGRGG